MRTSKMRNMRNRRRGTAVLFALLLTASTLMSSTQTGPSFMGGATNVEAAQVMCTACFGRGFINCFVCGGTGFRYGFNYITQRTEMQICTACGGRRNNLCYRCGGRGYWDDGRPSPTPTPTPTPSNPSGGTYSGGCVIAATKGVVSGEEAINLFDNKNATKFNVKSKSAYVIWKAPAAINVIQYIITTANDNAKYKGRNPKSWVLYGSTKKLSRNSSAWVRLHAVSNDKRLADKNFKSYTYKLAKTAKAYQYYKLEITANKGADCTQMAAFTLRGRSAALKGTAFTSVKKSGAAIAAKWAKRSGVTGYQIEYSASSAFKNSKTVTIAGTSATSRTIKVTKGKTYYLRIRTYQVLKGAWVWSSWSAKKAVKI